MDDLTQLRDKVAISCNILAFEGHWDNILGHVSARIPGENAMLMKPHSFGFEEIRPYHIIKVDFDGNKIEGDYERHSEVFIHTEAYSEAARVIEQAAGCDALLLTQQRVSLSREIIEHLPELRFISQTGRNTYHLDIAACTEHHNGFANL